MGSSSTEHLMQMGKDVSRLFDRAPKGLGRLDEHGWIGLSGERGTADFNMAAVARTAPVSLVAEYVAMVRERELNAIFIVDEDAPALVDKATQLGLVAVGNVPVMEWAGKPSPVPRSDSYSVRMATKKDVRAANTLLAQAFSLDEEMVQRVVPPEVMDDGVDVWLVEDNGQPVGCGAFIRSGDHVGVYSMATPEPYQRKGIGRRVLESAMAHYINEGVSTFTLEATEAGFHLYEQVGYETVASPSVLLIGESTQFPG